MQVCAETALPEAAAAGSRMLDLLSYLRGELQLKSIHSWNQGTYGEVVIGLPRLAGEQPVALKVQSSLCSEGKDAPGVPSVAVREVRAMHAVRHPHCMPLNTTFSWRGMFVTCMPWYPHTLIDVMAHGCCKDAWTRWSIFRDVVRGAAAAHAAGFAHRDIKPANVMLRGALAADDVVLGDWGLSRSVAEAAPGYLSADVVTTWWAPAEVLCESPAYGCAVDVWSLGMLLLDMCVGGMYYHMKPGCAKIERKDFMEQVLDLVGTTGLSAARASWLADVMTSAGYPHRAATDMRRGTLAAVPALAADALALDLVQRMLSLHPDDRPSLAEVLEHPFLAAQAPPPEWKSGPLPPPKNIKRALVSAPAPPARLLDVWELAPARVCASLPPFPPPAVLGWNPALPLPAVKRLLLCMRRTLVNTTFQAYTLAMRMSWAVPAPSCVAEPGLMFACLMLAHISVCCCSRVDDTVRETDGSHMWFRIRKEMEALGVESPTQLAYLERYVLSLLGGWVPAVPDWACAVGGAHRTMFVYLASFPALVLALDAPPCRWLELAKDGVFLQAVRRHALEMQDYI